MSLFLPSVLLLIGLLDVLRTNGSIQNALSLICLLVPCIQIIERGIQMVGALNRTHEKTRGDWGESEGSFRLFPFSLPSFFFLINFSPSLYHLNARNRLLIFRSFCSVIWIFLLMEHWSLLLSLLSLFQEFRSWGQRKEMWAGKKKQQQRGGGVAVRASLLSSSPLFPPDFFPLFSFAPHSTIRTPGTG